MENTTNQQTSLLLDGIHFVNFKNRDAQWRLASVNNSWPQYLSANMVENTAGQDGVWIQKASSSPKLAVMCCGLGSTWPGMGRELYDQFPACREAMDRLAALADWDLLSIMDEKDIEVINQTRIQIPYLFMLEYAQWSQFVSLGLKPALMCGHSIGELSALCFAGVYAPETAWHLLDTRAEHIARLEQKMAHEAGMLAVVGDRQALQETLASHPGISIANYNSPRQFVLSGPREELLFIRKSLRKNRIPAIMLGMHLPFHSPAMRILRDLSVFRLNALEMHAPAMPMLSCVRNGYYPENQDEICEYIADLDENTVNWVGSLERMANGEQISAWLELGPQETLCGLVTENLGDRLVIPASRKGAEAQTLREACCRLHINGLLDLKKAGKRAQTPVPHDKPAGDFEKSEGAVARERADYGECGREILGILAQSGRIKVEELDLRMNLRRDLAIRSSRFPFILQEIEKKLQKQVPLEVLFSLESVEDLVRLFCSPQGKLPAQKKMETVVELPHFASGGKYRLYRRDILTGKEELYFFCAGKKSEFPFKGAIFLGHFNPSLSTDIYRELFYENVKIIAPESLKAVLPTLKTISYIPTCEKGNLKQWRDFFEGVCRDIPELAGMIIALPNSGEVDKTAGEMEQVRLVYEYFKDRGDRPWLLSLTENTAIDCGDNGGTNWPGQILHTDQSSLRIILQCGHDRKNFEKQLAEELMRVLYYGPEGSLIYKRADEVKSNIYPECLSPLNSPLIRKFENSSMDWKTYSVNVQYGNLAGDGVAGFGALKLQNAGHPEICSGAPCVPVGKLLENIIASTHAVYPWLFGNGISDVYIKSLLPVPAGIIREGTITLHPQTWFKMENEPAKLVKGELEVKNITDNGRTLPQSTKIINCSVLLNPERERIRPLWPESAVNYAGKLEGLETFYERAAIGKKWQYIEKILKLDKQTGEGTASPDYFMTLSKKAVIAVNGKWGYKNFYSLINACVMGGWATLCLARDNEDAPPANLKNFMRWQPATIGHIRFDTQFTPDREIDGFGLYLKRAWNDNNVIRFNAQVNINGLKPIMILYYLEFARVQEES